MFYHSKNSAETEGAKSREYAGVVAHPIQAAIAFGELSNYYGVLHYPGGTEHLFY